MLSCIKEKIIQQGEVQFMYGIIESYPTSPSFLVAVSLQITQQCVASAYHVGDILEHTSNSPNSKSQKGVIVAITLRIGQKTPKPNIFVQFLAPKNQLIAQHHAELIKGWQVHGRIGVSIWQEKSNEWIKQVIRKEQVAYSSIQKKNKETEPSTKVDVLRKRTSRENTEDNEEKKTKKVKRTKGGEPKTKQKKTKKEKKQKKEHDEDANHRASVKELLTELTQKQEQAAKSQEQSLAAMSRQLKEQKEYVESKLLIFSNQLPQTPVVVPQPLVQSQIATARMDPSILIAKLHEQLRQAHLREAYSNVIPVSFLPSS